MAADDRPTIAHLLRRTGFGPTPAEVDAFVADDAPAAFARVADRLLASPRFGERLAMDWLDAALSNRPGVQPMLLNQARCREELGDLTGALVGYAAAFQAFRDQPSAITYLNFVLRHGGPDVCLEATETVLPVVGDEYRSAFLTSAAAVMLRAGRTGEAAGLVARALAVGDSDVARATVTAMAEHFGEPGLLLLPEHSATLGAAR